MKIYHSYCLGIDIKLRMNKNYNKPLVCDFSASNASKYLGTTCGTKKYNPIYFYFKRIQFLNIDTFKDSSYFCTFLQPTHRL